MNSHATITRKRKIKILMEGFSVKEICACEEYALRGLKEEKDRVGKLTAAAKAIGKLWRMETLC